MGTMIPTHTRQDTIPNHTTTHIPANTTHQRGGAGNVNYGDPPLDGPPGQRAEQDYVPETSTTEKHQENFHTGVRRPLALITHGNYA